MSRDKKVGPIATRSGLFPYLQAIIKIKVMKPKTICTFYSHSPKSTIARGENNDCTVYAFATAFDVPYDEAHKVLATRFDRKPRKGPKCWTLVKGLSNKFIYAGKKIAAVLERPITFYTNRGELFVRRMSLGTFAKTYTQGSYYVLISGHALAVKDGVVMDNLAKPRLKAPVTIAFKVEPLVEGEAESLLRESLKELVHSYSTSGGEETVDIL